jgi:hypothetical protein
VEFDDNMRSRVIAVYLGLTSKTFPFNTERKSLFATAWGRLPNRNCRNGFAVEEDRGHYRI